LVGEYLPRNGPWEGYGNVPCGHWPSYKSSPCPKRPLPAAVVCRGAAEPLLRATLTDSNSLTFITRTNRGGAQRPTCSPKTRPGGSQPISRSYQSCCAGIEFKAPPKPCLEYKHRVALLDHQPNSEGPGGFL